MTAETANEKIAAILCHSVNFFSVITRKDTKIMPYLCKKNITMADNDWKSRLGVVYSTNPDYQYQNETVLEQETLPPSKQRLIVRIDRRQRAGKQVTLVEGFVGTSDDLAALAKTLKTKCGVGGTAKDGEITVQGDLRDKVVALLQSMGYNARRGN